MPSTTRDAFRPAEIVATLDQRMSVDLAAEGGRLTMEQPHPFLCLYRQAPDRADAGTADLLFGQASFAIAPPAGSATAGFAATVEAVLAHLAKTFGSALLVELWSLDQPVADAGQSLTIQFEIRSTAGTSADVFVEALERALLMESWPGAGPTILEKVARSPHPPGRRGIIPAARSRSMALVMVSLGVSPIYRDPETGALLPSILSEIKSSFGRALKKALYAFCHASSVHRPAHYHELGRTRLMENTLGIDRSLGTISDAFDPLLFASPVNTDTAWNAFRAGHCDKPPQFNYRPLPVDPSALKRDLFAIPIDRVEDPTLHCFFASKREELDRQITLMADRETERFVLTSQQIYGTPDATLIALAEEILDALPPHARDDRSTDAIDAETFAEAARAELDSYGMDRSMVSVRDDIPGIMVSQGRLLIARHATIPRRRIRPTLDHEVGVHMLTYHNGRQQPLTQLRLGMAGYEELQEGLAVFAEYCSGGLTVPRWRQIAGRVVAAASLVDGGDFIDTFRLLNHRRGFSQRAAFMMAMRTHRGGGLTKDVVYLRGLTLLINHLATGGEIAPLLVGKIAFHLTHITEELRWRGIIKPPAVYPEIFSERSLVPVLRLLRNGYSVAGLAKQAAS